MLLASSTGYDQINKLYNVILCRLNALLRPQFLNILYTPCPSLKYKLKKKITVFEKTIDKACSIKKNKSQSVVGFTSTQATKKQL